MEQQKVGDYWNLKEGDMIKGKKIMKVEFYEDKYSGNHLKLIKLEDGSEYMLDESGLNRVMPNE